MIHALSPEGNEERDAYTGKVLWTVLCGQQVKTRSMAEFGDFVLLRDLDPSPENLCGECVAETHGETPPPFDVSAD